MPQVKSGNVGNYVRGIESGAETIAYSAGVSKLNPRPDLLQHLLIQIVRIQTTL